MPPARARVRQFLDMLKWRLASRQLLRSSVKAHIALRRRTLASHGGHVGVDAGAWVIQTTLSVRSKNGEGLFSAPFPLPPSNSKQFSARSRAGSEAQHLRGVQRKAWERGRRVLCQNALRMAHILQSWGVAQKIPSFSRKRFQRVSGAALPPVCVSLASPMKTSTGRPLPRSLCTQLQALATTRSNAGNWADCEPAASGAGVCGAALKLLSLVAEACPTDYSGIRT